LSSNKLSLSTFSLTTLTTFSLSNNKPKAPLPSSEAAKAGARGLTAAAGAIGHFQYNLDTILLNFFFHDPTTSQDAVPKHPCFWDDDFSHYNSVPQILFARVACADLAPRGVANIAFCSSFQAILSHEQECVHNSRAHSAAQLAAQVHFRLVFQSQPGKVDWNRGLFRLSLRSL